MTAYTGEPIVPGSAGPTGPTGPSSSTTTPGTAPSAGSGTSTTLGGEPGGTAPSGTGPGGTGPGGIGPGGVPSGVPGGIGPGGPGGPSNEPSSTGPSGPSGEPGAPGGSGPGGTTPTTPRTPTTPPKRPGSTVYTPTTIPRRPTTTTTTTSSSSGGGGGGGGSKIITPSSATSGITDLSPGLIKGSAFQFASEPSFSPQVTPMDQISSSSDSLFASGGSTTVDSTDIEDLKPGIVKGSRFSFSNEPKFSAPLTTIPSQSNLNILNELLGFGTQEPRSGLAEGGTVPEMPEMPSLVLRPGFLKGRPFNRFNRFGGVEFAGYEPRKFADGGDVAEHKPQFFSEGGLQSMENTFVRGEGDGTSDSVPAMLANGEFVIPADVVSKLGNGSNGSGATILDQFLTVIREHSQNHNPKKLPPDSKGPLAYLLQAKRKAG